MINFLQKIYCSLNNKILFNRSRKKLSVKEQREYLNEFPMAKDEYDLSFYKYKCVCQYYYLPIQIFFLNFISALVFPFLFCFYFLKGKNVTSMENQKNMLLIREGNISIEDIFPEQLKSRYDEFSIIKNVDYSQIFFTKQGRRILTEARKKHPFAFRYLLVLLIRLSQACYIVTKYSPKCVTTYVCEREFSDPLVTKFYEDNNIEYHGFMHGDYLYSLDKAFMHYSCYWVWDKHYERMFFSLKYKGKIQIHTPKKYEPIKNKKLKCDYFATYYFSGENKEIIDHVKSAFDIIKAYGKKCKVRPHPRFSNVKYIKEVFRDYYVENPYEVSIEDSINDTCFSIAIVTTVLSKAYYSSKKIVIDDISNINCFKDLQEREYILIDKADMMFSDLIERVKSGDRTIDDQN